MTAPPYHVATMARARAQLEAIAEPRAAGPGPDVLRMRRAYLDLLKLCLCDLAGTSTTSVGALEDGVVFSREMSGAEARLRAAGMDWPLHGLTMLGLTRLDDLQECVEDVHGAGVRGDVIEAGSWRGGASMLMRAALDTLGDERTVFVADSFCGFPQAGVDEDSPDQRGFEFLAASFDGVRASFERFGLTSGVQFVPGFFEETLQGLAEQRWAIVRLDADSYSATRHALRWLYPNLEVGGHLIVDDYLAFPGCRRAIDEFRAEHGIEEPIHEVDWTCVRWRRESDHSIALPEAAVSNEPPAPVHTPSPTVAVPTAHELELEKENARLRELLGNAQAQIGLRAWARRRLGKDGGS
jgi:O-methyltransferase